MSLNNPVPEPIMHYSFALASEGGSGRHFGDWREVGQYWIWSATLHPTDQPMTVLEMTEKGAIEFKNQEHFMHPVPSGRPHHITHLFGYWQASDADRIWLQVPRDDTYIHTIIWGGKRGTHRREQLSWFCPRCGNRLTERLLDLSDSGLAGFVKEQVEAVRRFNSDRELRTCKGCGFVHPEAYGFYPGEDTLSEQASRKLW